MVSSMPAMRQMALLGHGHLGAQIADDDRCDGRRRILAQHLVGG
jgi:hypothetical protein